MTLEFPAFSPDGRRLAYVATVPLLGDLNADWGSDIHLVNVDGGGDTTVWRRDAHGVTVDSLSWDASASALRFGYYRPLFQDGKFTGQQARVMQLDPTDGQTRLLLDDADYPAFSPDGRSVAFLRSSGGSTALATIYVANADGTSARPLLAAGAPVFGAKLYPRFTPDSQAVVFSALVPGDGEGTAHAAHPGGLPGGPLPAGQAGAGPVDRLVRLLLGDGRASAHGGPWDLYRAPLDGGTPRRMTTLDEDEPYFVFAPDGHALLVYGASGLYVGKPDGTGLQKIDPGMTHGQADWTVM